MTNAIHSVVGIIIAFGLAFGQLLAEPPGYVITGTVVDASGAAITGAKVSLFRTTDSVPIAVTKTDGKGEFQFVVGDIQEFRLVPEATCFNPTIVQGISGERDEHNELPPIILQVSACSGDAVEPLPVMTDPDPSELPKSLEPSEKVNIVTVCELFGNLRQYGNTDVAVVGRLDQPGESLIDHYKLLAQDHCKHPIVTKGYVWPRKVFISVQTEETLPGPPNNEPELDPVVLAENVSAIRKNTKLGFHKEPQFKNQDGSVVFSKFIDVRDEWVVTYGRVVWAPKLAREPCPDEIGCGGFLGAPLAIIVAPKNVHIINKDGTLRRSSEQDDK